MDPGHTLREVEGGKARAWVPHSSIHMKANITCRNHTWYGWEEGGGSVLHVSCAGHSTKYPVKVLSQCYFLQSQSRTDRGHLIWRVY